MYVQVWVFPELLQAFSIILAARDNDDDDDGGDEFSLKWKRLKIHAETAAPIKTCCSASSVLQC